MSERDEEAKKSIKTFWIWALGISLAFILSAGAVYPPGAIVILVLCGIISIFMWKTR